MDSTTKTPGSTWVIMNNGKLWPCVVFQVSRVPRQFLELRGHRFTIPVFVLGRRKLVWCMERDLHEYIPSSDYLREESAGIAAGQSRLPRTSEEEKRKDAFEEAFEWHPMQYFEDIVAAKLAEYAEDRPREEKIDTNTALVRARSVIDLCSSDEEVDAKAKTTASSNQYGKKGGSQDRTGRAETIEGTTNKPNSSKKGKEKIKTTLTQVIPNLPLLKSRGISTHQPTPKTPMFRQAGYRFKPDDDVFNLLANMPSDSPSSRPTSVHTKGGTGDVRGTQKGAAEHEKNAEERADSQNQAHICIGKEPDESYFVTNMAVIKKYQYFTENLRLNDRSGLPCVRASELADLDRDEFVPVAEYLDNGDYNPVLVNSAHPYLFGVHNVNQHEQTAILTGGVWNRAKYMQIQPLMELVVKKIHAQWPLANDVLLLFTRLVFFSDNSGLKVEIDLRDELKQEIVSRFYSLMEEESRLLARVMKSSDEIAADVCKAISEEPAKAADGNVDIDMEDDDD